MNVYVCVCVCVCVSGRADLDDKIFVSKFLKFVSNVECGISSQLLWCLHSSCTRQYPRKCLLRILLAGGSVILDDTTCILFLVPVSCILGDGPVNTKNITHFGCGSDNMQACFTQFRTPPAAGCTAQSVMALHVPRSSVLSLVPHPNPVLQALHCGGLLPLGQGPGCHTLWCALRLWSYHIVVRTSAFSGHFVQYLQR